MDPRQQRGLVIAATQKLVQKGKVWLVGSQTGSGKRYTVCPDEDCPYCSCPDHEETGLPCKHVFAVRFTLSREQEPDGAVTETKTLTLTQKKTYRQDWPIYNLGQLEETRRFMVLLHDLCRGLKDPPQPKGGRRRTPMADMAFTCALKVFVGFSARRFGTDLEEATEKAYISKKFHPGMTWAWLESPLLTPALQECIKVSSLPLRAVETAFAPDSTGCSTSRHVRWHDEKYGTVRSGRDWVKAHAMVGTRTHIVTAVEILDRDAADAPQFKPLVEKTAAAGFDVREVPADKAYLSHENLELVQDLGGTAYIPFKVNSTPGEPGSLWEKMYLYYSLRREDFGQHYHKRSNAESGFSMMKAKFRDHVRSKTDVAMRNEVLCKVVCHNVCCLIMSQLELGIEPEFWGPAQPDVAMAGTTPVDEPAPMPAAAAEVPPTRAAVRTVYGTCAGA
jgi:transposase